MADNEGTVRIIGGRFRGKKLTFPLQDSLRPTQDRIRETLFNWLMNDIVDANCLDIFAGTGALGLEALSRGAQHVTFVDNDNTVMNTLKKNAATFSADQLTFIRANYKEALLSQAPFDIVFIDPPFSEQLQVPVAQWLEAQHYLTAKAFIYIEAKKGSDMAELPEDWVCLKQSSTATIDYYLYSRTG